MKREETGSKYDPIEDDPKIKPIIQAAENEAEKQLVGFGPVLGYCHLFWATKQEILKVKYGIEWKSPAEMNPTVLFD
ncbi:MAG: hypothetical protein ABI210_09285 [Abditibacteriaceae bacterium]